MKKLIELFNKKYGHIYGVIDDSVDNEDVFKAYKIIKTLCADDIEIMELLDRVKLPSPKTAKESIDKIDAEYVNGGGMSEDDLMKYNIPFDSREATEIIYDGDMENYENIQLEEGVYYVKLLNEPIEPECLEGGSFVTTSPDGTLEVSIFLDTEDTVEGVYTFNEGTIAVVKKNVEGLPLSIGVWILYIDEGEPNYHISRIKYFSDDNFNLLDEKFIPYIPGKKNKNNAEIFNDMINNIAEGKYSHAEGQNTTARGYASHAEGYYGIASGDYSHVEGRETITYGNQAHAEGYNTQAEGNSSHTEGNNTRSMGKYSHSEGESSYKSDNTIISSTSNDDIITKWEARKFSLTKGRASHTEGLNGLALGDYSHVEGCRTIATGESAHVEGMGTKAKGLYSHAEGESTNATGKGSHSEGIYSVASGDYSHAEGNSFANGKDSHSEGGATRTFGQYSHAEGRYAVSLGESSHAEGESEWNADSRVTGLSVNTSDDTIINEWKDNKFSLAKGEASHVEGKNNLALGNYSHAEGMTTTASREGSHAEGYGATASGLDSHAEGSCTEASGGYSHAEGTDSTASGEASHAEGNGTKASGSASHAEGVHTTANGGASHAEGSNTKASSNYQHVQGKYNIEDTENKYAHIVGNGTSDSARSNAHTLDWNGNGWYKGKLSQDGTPTEDKDLTTKKYVDDKTEILPVKNTYTIFEDAVPRLMEDTASTYIIGGEFKDYIFDSLQNEDMISSAIKYNLSITFNDGTNDITKDLILENIYNGNVHYEDEDILLSLEYIEKEHSIGISVNKALDFSPYDILKATISYDCYVNLLQNYHIQNIDYDKIERVPTALNSIANYENFTLKGKEYYELYDNLSIWDANKFNERLDENSGVKRNEFFKLPGKDNYTMRIKQKDSEGIGFGQHISIDNSKNVHIVADAGVDVIIKIYNSTTKELIGTLNYCEAGFYKTRIINKNYLNGVTSIFIAFTVKDSTESFYGNTYINDLIVHYDSSFLVKEEILTKTNTKEYIPTGDYNPATKKYVDEKIASIDTTINTLPVNGSLNLTTSKFQTTTLATDTEVILPTVEGYTEIHLFFLGISGTNVSDTNVAWNSKPTIEDNKKYEFIYTYVNSEIGWLGKAVVYTL